MIEERWDTPPTWSWVSMGEAADVVGGGTPSTSDDDNFAEHGIPWLTPADLTGHKGVYISRGRRDLSERGYRASAARIMPPGTVLFSSRAPVGYCAIAAGEISTNQGFKSFVLRGGLSSEYIRHYLLGSVDYAESKASGTTFKELSGSRAAELAVPIAPLPEQRRIVAKIDSLTGKSKRARDHLDHIPRLVEKYKQAVLAAAFSEAYGVSGHLTALGDVASEVRNGLSKKPTDGPEGTPILRISAVRPRQVRVGEVRYYPTDEVPASAMLRGGDLLFTRYNGNPEFTAVCGQVRDVADELTYPDKLIRVRVVQGVDPSFVELMSTSEQARNWLNPHIKSAAGQHGISGADLKRLPIPMPHLAVQNRIVRRVETAFTWIDRSASEVTSARKLIDWLDQTILAKAFRGELVPQDPADEPASVLLERIGAERGAAPKAKRARNKAR